MRSSAAALCSDVGLFNRSSFFNEIFDVKTWPHQVKFYTLVETLLRLGFNICSE